MNVLVIGSGGREHALSLKISQSNQLVKLFCIPGNPGTELLATNVDIPTSNKEKIGIFCRDYAIDLIVIGPEQPLVEGLSDYLRSEGFIVFGPSANAAQIESSKAFAKKIMYDAHVPTGSFTGFDETEYDDAFNFIGNITFPIVIKYDGLAAGKGVFICVDKYEAENALFEIFEYKSFAESRNKIIIEEFLLGEEASIFAITDGEDFICLPAAQDHKRIGDNDTGKNTGGMGAYAPAPIVTNQVLKQVEEEIIRPTLREMNKSGNKFVGCLYVGLMITNEGPKVIEFNCRFGDPETQVVLPLLDGDFLELLYSASSGKLNKEAVKYSGGSSVCVVAASNGYPDIYKKGFKIKGLDQSDDEIIIYHAGTKKEDNKILTNGGRVLGVTSVIKNFNLQTAQQKAYNAIKKIHFDGIYYRNDIAEKAFKHLK
jgi:phosphoribosylamine---glycine ligase